MTTRLYYHDPRLLEFDAIAVEHDGDAQRVVLDRTAFYPTSGGQPHDTGVLGGARVTDVIDQDARIVHVLDAALALGPVHGAVDGVRRHDHMQQHSAQHVLSALAADRLGWDTASVHFGEDHSTIEFTVAAVSDRQTLELERWANDVVADAREVSIGFEDAAAADRMGLRKPSGRKGEIRVIVIADLDRSACGGTHVARTSEIGCIQLLHAEKVRGHVRIGFLAGGRVLAQARASGAALAGVARAMNCAVGELDALVPARQAEYKALRDQIAMLECEVAASRVDALVTATARDADGIRRIRHHASDESATILRTMAQAIAPLDHVMFAAVAPVPPTIYFATSADTGIDAGAVLKPMLAAAGGRGGGSARVAQGTAATRESLDDIATTVLRGGTA